MSADQTHIAIEQLLVSDGYQIVMARVEGELERRRNELESPKGPEQTAFIRGQIASLRTVLGLATIMREEAKAALKEEDE